VPVRTSPKHTLGLEPHVDRDGVGSTGARAKVAREDYNPPPEKHHTPSAGLAGNRREAWSAVPFEAASLERLGDPVLSAHGIQYRADIDGLRAVAVCAVLMFHAFPTLLPGGFIGVDVFFVISGFLITTIILSPLEQGTFDCRDFYARRVKRIFPALSLVLIATFVFGWFVLVPADLALLGKHTAAGAGFLSNFVLWAEVDYFDRSADSKPLLHLWSLAVEEQFYLVWPALLVVAHRRRWPMTTLLGVIAAASFTLNVGLIERHQAAAFYLPLSRFWELILGGMLATVSMRVPLLQSAWSKHVLSIAGCGLIIVGLIWANNTRAFPGWWALLPVLGAAACIAAGPFGLINRFALSTRPAVWTGMISYPLYLWHWPLLVFARVLAGGEPSVQARVAVLVASGALALLTYLLLEKPIRFGRGNQSLTIGALGSAITACAAIGLMTQIGDGFGARLIGTDLAYASHAYDFRSDARVGECWVSNAAPADAHSRLCDEGDVLVWGDSHAARFAPGLTLVLGAPVAQLTRDTCPPALGHGSDSCKEGNERVLERIRTRKPRTVVLFAYWIDHFAPRSDLSIEQVRSTIATLKQGGVEHVIVMGPAPRWAGPLPSLLARHRVTRPLPFRTRDDLMKIPARVDRMMGRALADARDASYFSTYQALCDADGCLALLQNSPEGLTTFDHGHLTTSASRYVAERLVHSNSLAFAVGEHANPSVERQHEPVAGHVYVRPRTGALMTSGW